MEMVAIKEKGLSIEEVVAAARHRRRVKLDSAACERVERCRRVVEEIVERGETVYGINTGVGELCSIVISKDDIEKLQANLIYSHCCGVGDPLPEEVVRATMFLAATSLAKGYSGVRVEIVRALVDMLNENVVPLIPEKGSVGASGDLAPLAHMALSMMGEWQAFYNGELLSSAEALKRADIEPVKLKAKEGLAIINGTQIMTAIAALLVYDTENLLKVAQISSAMSLEALRGTNRPFSEKLHLLRPHPGQVSCARNIRKLIAGSGIVAAPGERAKLQDAYTLRCIPQVYGASKDALNYVRGVVEVEINSVTDNPLIFPEDRESISGGNFHGQPIALAMDFLAIAISEIGDISERTVDRLVNPYESGLPAFLTEKSGLNSGFMVSQYTAAALVSENKILSHPASVDSIPTSAGQEDHVSMGTIAATKARQILSNVEYVIAIELLCACQGLEFQKPLKPGRGVGEVYKLIRNHVSRLDGDRPLNPDIEKVARLIKEGQVVAAAEGAVGKLE